MTGITGLARGEIVTSGRAGHAGTVPMAGRADALVAAAELILRIRDTAARIEGAVATVGRLEVEPGALNVIPQHVAVSIDARAPDPGRFEELIAAIGFEPTYRVEPVAMARGVQDALRAAIEARGLPVVELASGAGHDAGILAAAGVESGMLFVRSQNGGVSHHPDELTTDEDVALAVDVLAETLAGSSRLRAGGDPLAEQRRSAGVMCVVFPNGINVESTATVLISSACDAISCGVSNTIPFGAEVNCVERGWSEWQRRSAARRSGRSARTSRASPPRASRRGGSRRRARRARRPPSAGSTRACGLRGGC